jgi:hypothetical protein
MFKVAFFEKLFWCDFSKKTTNLAASFRCISAIISPPNEPPLPLALGSGFGCSWAFFSLAAAICWARLPPPPPPALPPEGGGGGGGGGAGTPPPPPAGGAGGAAGAAGAGGAAGGVGVGGAAGG